MNATMLNTLGGPWRKFRTVNCTDTSFPSKIPTVTEPSGVGATAGGAAVIDLINSGSNRFVGSMQNGINLVFFGAGSDTNTFSCRGIGWSCISDSPALAITDDTRLWIPTPLFEVSVALSVQVGIAGKSVINTDRFADAISITTTTANQGVDVDVRSPANDTMAEMYVDLRGHMKFELIFDCTGATDCNALYRLF